MQVLVDKLQKQLKKEQTNEAVSRVNAFVLFSTLEVLRSMKSI